MANGMRGPRPMQKKQRLYEPPKSLKEVPGYLGRVIGGFFARLFYIVRLVWETSPFLFCLMALLCVASGVLPVVLALISRDLLNAVNDALITNGVDLHGEMLSSVFGWLGGVAYFILWQFLFQLLNRVVSSMRTTVNNMTGEMVSNHIKLKIMQKAKTVDLASFDNPAFYERLENANREAGMRPISILTATFDVIAACISAVSFIVLLSNIGWIAPVAVLLLAAPTAIINYTFRNKGFWYMRFRSKERRQMNYYANTVTDKDRAAELRIMNLSDTFIGKYEETFKTYFKGLKKLILQEGFWQVMGGLISRLTEAVLFFYVAYHVVNGSLTVGDYSLYAGALTSIGGYAMTMISATAVIYEGTLFIENVREFMKEEVHILPSVETPLIPARHIPHTVTFENVSFRYPGTDRDVIKNLSVTLRGGEKVVLVGLNGAGKTTLIKLLTRLYDPTEGRILLDGHDLREYDPRALYDLFGIIFQDFGKYALTVGENIAIGDVSRGYDPEAVKGAAEKGNAASFIGDLKEGYGTPLMRWFEEEGTELSIGQWQKLSIARAFYKDSDILILDEPTASLDALAEQEVFSQIAALSENKLVVFVSHRLSSATTADHILVIDNGTLTEYGDHETLMAKGGTYHTLFTAQASRYMSSDRTETHDPPLPYQEDPGSI